MLLYLSRICTLFIFADFYFTLKKRILLRPYISPDTFVTHYKNQINLKLEEKKRITLAKRCKQHRRVGTLTGELVLLGSRRRHTEFIQSSSVWANPGVLKCKPHPPVTCKTVIHSAALCPRVSEMAQSCPTSLYHHHLQMRTNTLGCI